MVDPVRTDACTKPETALISAYTRLSNSRSEPFFERRMAVQCQPSDYYVTYCTNCILAVRHVALHSSSFWLRCFDLSNASFCTRTAARGQYETEDKPESHQSKRGKYGARYYSRAICALTRNCCFLFCHKGFQRKMLRATVSLLGSAQEI